MEKQGMGGTNVPPRRLVFHRDLNQIMASQQPTHTKPVLLQVK